MKRNITTYPRAPPFPVWFQIIKITNQTEEFKMAKDFYKSNYGKA